MKTQLNGFAAWALSDQHRVKFLTVVGLLSLFVASHFAPGTHAFAGPMGGGDLPTP